MSYCLKAICFLLLLIPLTLIAGKGETHFALPDSVRATSVYLKIKPVNNAGKKGWETGLTAGPVRLTIFSGKKKAGYIFSYPEALSIVAMGDGVSPRKLGGLVWNRPLNAGDNLSLMISMASDSAANFVLYSAYVFVPEASKWKLIGTCKLKGFQKNIQHTGVFWEVAQKDTSLKPAIQEVWAQRPNGSWKNLLPAPKPNPSINLLSHIDSLSGIVKDSLAIEKAISDKKIDPLSKEKGIFYEVLKEGSGRAIQVSDTVRVYYKGSLFSDGSVFDQTTTEARRFPLARLIYGWQVGVPLIKEGGKIKLVIPSHLGYSIRTRSAKIPPNSILVFEIEVLETTPVVKQLVN